MGALAAAPPGAESCCSGIEGEGPLDRDDADEVGPPGALVLGFTGPGALAAVPIGGWTRRGGPIGPPGARDIVAGLTLACGATAASWSATVGRDRCIPGGGLSREEPGGPIGGGGPGKLFWGGPGKPEGGGGTL